MVVLLKATKKKLMNLGYSTMSCVVIKVTAGLFRAKDRAVFRLQRIRDILLVLIPLYFGLAAKKKVQCLHSSWLAS